MGTVGVISKKSNFEDNPRFMQNPVVENNHNTVKIVISFRTVFI